MKIDDDTELWVVNEKEEQAERLSGFFVYHADRPKIKNKEFFFMFQQSLKLISKNPDLNGSDIRVFLFLLSELDFENFIHVTQKDIANETQIKQPNVSTALSKLVKLNIIEKVAQGNIKAYRLNPSYAWKGSIKSLKDEEKSRKVIPFKKPS